MNQYTKDNGEMKFDKDSEFQYGKTDAALRVTG